jgi:peptidylprolyl isomerase
MTLAACTSSEVNTGTNDETQPFNSSQTPAADGGEMAQGPPAVSGEPITTGSGLQFIEIEQGSGDAPKASQTVVVHYTGWLESDGTKFDSSVDRGTPFSFTIGEGKVIRGWDEGLATMQVGGKRRLIIPPDLAYGEAGAGGGAIPPNATLIFDVELLEIR